MDRPFLDHGASPDAERYAPHNGQGVRRDIPPGTVIFDSLSVVESTARHFGMSIEELRGVSRHHRFTEARGAGYWLLWRHSRLTCTQIAEAFNKKDHTTVLYGIKRCEKRRAEDTWFRAHLEDLERKLEDKAKGAAA